ncbi:MAG: hypothetical protein ACJ8AD_11710 [Gemmatimonadaceae bacterium]
MRLPMTARSRMFTLALLVAPVILAGCSSESTAPNAVRQISQQRTSPFAPTAAQKALVGISNGTYSLTFDPSQDNSFTLGANYLSLPANAVCKLDGSSGYGAEYWNQSCVPETDSVTISVVISDAETDHPRLDFYPAMRFNPETNVSLYIYVPVGMDDFLKNWVMRYCDDTNTCINEAANDADLASYADHTSQMVFRRIKHFSGYLVNRADDAVDAFTETF